MKSALAIGLAAALAILPESLLAQQSAGPIGRSAERTVIRLAADNAGPSSSATADQPRPLELKWTELASVIGGHDVELSAPGGVLVRGEVISVRDDALVLDVSRSSDTTKYPKGSASIPRASVQELTVDRSRGSAGKNLGTIIGVIAGVIAGGYIAGTTTDSASAGIPMFIGLASGMTVAGYYIGKSADKHTTVIHVVQ